MPDIELSGKIYTYEIERKPIRSLRLRLKTSEFFIVSCHSLTPNFLVTKFIVDHSDWIIKNSAKFRAPTVLKSLDKLSILGNDYQIIYHQTGRDSVVVLTDEHKIFVNSNSHTNSHLRNLLNQKLRPLALKLIKSELSELSALHGFKHGKVSVRNQTSRFGSCSFRGNLSFNWQIILFPHAVFSHILLHELTHIHIKNHSVKFWTQLSVYDPKYKTHNFWLKKEAPKFMLFS
jgi:predicted metal-dependent hydrolase